MKRFKVTFMPLFEKRKIKPAKEPLRVQNFLIFGAKNLNEAFWAYSEVQKMLPYYPQGFPQLTLNYKKRQFIVKEVKDADRRLLL